ALLPLLLLVLSSAVALANQRVLLYTAVANDGFYHPSIPAAVRAMKQLGEDNQVDMVHCNDRDEFEDLDLSQFDALAFVNAAGSILTKKGAGHMRNYIENGGGYIGVHEASCAATSTPWYLRLVGAQFSYHPEMSSATMDILDHDHPSTAHLPDRWDVVDEFYNFFSNPKDLGATVGVAADESTYWDEIQPLKERAKLQGSPHPISWWREGELLSAPKSKLGGGLDNLRKDIRKGIQGSGGAGRSWYTGLGHTSACWKKDDFLQHVWGGLTWVLDSTTIASNQLQPGPDTPGQKYN
ncbi:class I glutamine amidotransferase-like protein, partial [Jaminaea rosea]